MGKVFNSYLKRKINKHSVISFDIFETLIKRNCRNPHDIFDLVEKKYNQKYKNKITNFRKIRVEKEKELRMSCKKEEINIDEIYFYIDEFDEKQKVILKGLEIETELEFCVRNDSIYKIYEYCKNKDKKIICVSDMYLTKETILSILKNNGYEIDDLYLSSDIGLQKRSGKLFKYLINEKKYLKKNILHIGDSKRGDYISPKINGISSYLIKRYYNNCSYLKFDKFQNLDMKIMHSLINNKVVDRDSYYKIGYELLGPLIYSFCNWIDQKVDEKNINKIYFCARDMEFTQKIYNLVSKKKFNNKYLYISRKSLEQPYSYMNNSFEDFISTITPKKLNMKDILENKGIHIGNVDSYLEKYQIDNKQTFNNKTINNKKIKKFYDEVLKKYINEVAKKEYENFMFYMNSINFNPKDSLIVDLGWKGTIQYSLQKIYNEDILGLYFGLDENSFEELNNKACGFMFEKKRNQDISEKIYSFRSLFEMLFSATHGTTLKYIKDNENPVILGNYENLNSSLINRIQKGAYDFAMDFQKYSYLIDDVDVKIIIDQLLRIGINPSYEEASIFGEFNFDNMICGKLAKPKRLLYYFIHPKKLKKDIFLSEWKVGFLKRLLRLKLPYYKFYCFLKKFK